jgi:PTS system nitrogen regulatory IIA component
MAKLDRIVGIFAHLESPIDFESIDEAPVDLVFVLLTPADAGADHLKALARVSRLMRNSAVCEKLRAANDRAQLYAVLTEPTALQAA